MFLDIDKRYPKFKKKKKREAKEKEVPVCGEITLFSTGKAPLTEFQN